jgi:hypothetical protein
MKKEELLRPLAFVTVGQAFTEIPGCVDGNALRTSFKRWDNADAVNAPAVKRRIRPSFNPSPAVTRRRSWRADNPELLYRIGFGMSDAHAGEIALIIRGAQGVKSFFHLKKASGRT